MTSARFNNLSMTRTTPSDAPTTNMTMAEIAERRSAKSQREMMPLIDSYGHHAKTLKAVRENGVRSTLYGTVTTSKGTAFEVALPCEHLLNDMGRCRHDCAEWKAAKAATVA